MLQGLDEARRQQRRVVGAAGMNTQAQEESTVKPAGLWLADLFCALQRGLQQIIAAVYRVYQALPQNSSNKQH